MKSFSQLGGHQVRVVKGRVGCVGRMSTRGPKNRHSTVEAEEQVDAIENLTRQIRKAQQEAERDATIRQKAINGQQALLRSLQSLGNASKVNISVNDSM